MLFSSKAFALLILSILPFSVQASQSAEPLGVMQAEDKFVDNIQSSDGLLKLKQIYNKAVLEDNCNLVLQITEKMTMLFPNEANQLIGDQYQEGFCRERNIVKALKAFEKIPFTEIDPFYGLKLIYLRFSMAQNEEQKTQSLDGIKDVLLGFILLAEDAEGVKELVEILIPNSEDFTLKISQDLEYIDSLYKSDDLKLGYIKKFIAKSRFNDLTQRWLLELHSKGNLEAFYISASLHENDQVMQKFFLKKAAKGGHSFSQKKLAEIYLNEDEKGSLMYSYYWFLKSEQNGLDVKKQISEILQKLKASEIAVVEDEAKKETSSLF